MLKPESDVSGILKLLISALFSCAIVLGAVTILAPFLLPVLWAGIIAIASWPVHCHLIKVLPSKPTMAALLTTLMVAILLVAPVIVLIMYVARDVLTVVDFLILADTHGVAPPVWLLAVPKIGNWLEAKWMIYLAQPDRLSDVARQAVTARLSEIQSLAQTLLLDLTRRVATLFFALWVLFFFYRDGQRLLHYTNQLGIRWLGVRWTHYVRQVPEATRGAVNGLIIVGVTQAMLLSLLLELGGVPSGVLLGVLIAVLSLVPLLGPLLLLVICILLFAAGDQGWAVSIMVLGTLIMLTADYLVRPALIQGKTQLPFLAILFGIFGGIATMGVVGLIIGPVLLVLLLVLIRESVGKMDNVSQP